MSPWWTLCAKRQKKKEKRITEKIEQTIMLACKELLLTAVMMHFCLGTPTLK
jgi:hypothetical protein